jgi:hypothetical protein
VELLASQDEPQEEDDAGGGRGGACHRGTGEHEEDEEASASEAGESEGRHESVGADGDEELPVPQASQEDDDDQPRWRMMQHLPPRKKTGRRTTRGARGASDTIPTGKSTSGLSIKLVWKTPCLPISITIVGEIASALFYFDEHLGIGHQPFTNKIHLSSFPTPTKKLAHLQKSSVGHKLWTQK